MIFSLFCRNGMTACPGSDAAVASFLMDDEQQAS
jgi:hypothetical protein